MFDRGAERAARERELLAGKDLSEDERRRQMRRLRFQISRNVGKEGRFRPPPKRFSVGGALEHFGLSGDWPKK